MAKFSRLLLSGISVFAATLFTNAAIANTRTTVSGVPSGIMANSLDSGWLDEFVMPGSVGTCPGSTGVVYATMTMPGTTGSENPSSNRIWSLVLAAELANKPITVLLDDNIKDANGRCIAIWVSM